MNRRTKVLFAIVAAAAAGFVLDKLFLTPWLEGWDKLSAEIGQADKDLLKARAIVGREKTTQEGWDKVKALLAKPRVPDVQTHFVEHLGTICDRVGVNYDISQGSRVVQTGDFKEYVYETKFKLTYQKLGALLVELHNSKEFLKPTRINISSQYEREDRVDLDLKVSTIEYAPQKGVSK